jgi:putative transposase
MKRKKKSIDANLKPVKDLWYPSLNAISNNLDFNSWVKNNKIIGGEAIYGDYKYEKVEITKSYKIQVYPNKEQKIILNNWSTDCIAIYNETNKLIKNNIYNEDKTINIKKATEFVRFERIRTDYLKPFKNIHMEANNTPSHMLDYAIKLNCEMYKSAISNLKNKNIKEFNIKDCPINNRRRNIVIESNMFSKKINGFCVSQLGEMKFESKKKNKKLADIDFKNIKNNCILQFDSLLKKYYLIIPRIYESYDDGYKISKCGIDGGIRTFLTIYYNNRVAEIGTNISDKLKPLYNKIDKINKHKDEKLLTEQKSELAGAKRYKKIGNLVDDLHFKAIDFLANNFETIRLGKINTKSIVSNNTSIISDTTKRLIYSLRHYEFRVRLENKCKETGSKLEIVDEYKTSITCSRCSNEHTSLGANKIYDCTKCSLKIDRDINAAINMYK